MRDDQPKSTPELRSGQEVAETFEVFAKNHVKERIQNVAHQLRRMAEEVESITTQVDKDAVTAAGRVVHTVNWGLANLSLDILISNASQVRDAQDHINQEKISELLARIENGETS